MRIPPVIYAAVWLLGMAVLWWPADSTAQSLYTIGGASELQSLDLATHEVVNIATVTPLMSDIAFHPDGNLYGVSENSIYRVDTTDGSTNEVVQLPAAFGWLLGLTIDHNGVAYLSSLGADSDYLITYDFTSGQFNNLGSVGWKHWDLEFYNSVLYAAGGTDNPDEGLLIAIDTSDLSESKVILDYGTQAFALASFNDSCGGTQLVAPTLKSVKVLDPDNATFTSFDIHNDLYTSSLGATSGSSFNGSEQPLKINSIVLGNPPCEFKGSTTAEIVVEPGRQGVQFSLNGIDYQSSPVFSQLLPGIYKGYIRDARGCTDESGIFEILLNEPKYTVQALPAHCGVANGMITPGAVNAGDSLLFSLDGMTFTSSPQYTNLDSGRYNLYIKDTIGCVAVIDVHIGRLKPLTQDFQTTPEHCDQEDGVIEVNAKGGKAPYSYSIVALPPQLSPVFNDLHSGTYNIQTTDDLGCVAENAVDVGSYDGPEMLEIIALDAHCNQSDGQLTIITDIDPTGMQFALDGGPYQPDPVFSDLPPGDYTITAMDQFGCTASTLQTINNLAGPVIEELITQKDDCGLGTGRIRIEASSPWGNLKHSIDGINFKNGSVFANLTAGEYTVTVRDSFGCTASQKVEIISDPLPRIKKVDITHATCGLINGALKIRVDVSGTPQFSLNHGAFQDGDKFEDLFAGEYIVHVQDENGCRDSAYATIDDLEYVVINGTVTTDESCKNNDGEIRVMTNNIAGEMLYTIDGTFFQSSPHFTGLTSGEYMPYVIDDNGCEDSLFTVIHRIEPFRLEEVSVTPSECGMDDGSIYIKTDKPVEILINDDNQYTIDLIENLSAGYYHAVISDENHCTIDTIIEVPGTHCNIYIPNAFSPNGDGANDFFEPVFEAGQFDIERFDIFDRWGNNVFNCEYDCEWDGTIEGEPVPPGVYVYYLSVSDYVGNEMQYSGDLTLVR